MNEIVAYWNGAQLRDLFEAIVFIVGGGDFLGLLRTVAVFGLLIMTTMAVLRQRAIEPAAYIAALALFYSLMLVPKMTLTIKDVRSGGTFVVANVPYGVGVFASAASHIGVWLTDTFETAFAPADSLKFSRFGVVYPQRLLSAMQQLGPVTPEGREMVASLMKDCVVPEMLDDNVKATGIVNAPDIWTLIKSSNWLNPARFTISITGAPVSCPDHANDLETYFDTTEVPAMQKYLGNRMVPDHVDPSAAIASSIPQVETALLGMSRTMKQSLIQSAMLDSVPKGVALAGSLGQPLQTAMNLSTAQANMASWINYGSMANVARDALPKVRNTVEFIIIASFPLMLIMVIASGHYAGTMLRTYFVMLLWTQLWAPLYAVLNYLVISTDSSPLTQLATAYGGNSIASAGLIQEFGASSASIAGGLTVLVPIIAYYLASRAEIAATSMVSSIMQPAQQAGGSMAAQAAQGNVGMGQVSWGSVSTNNTASNKLNNNIEASSGLISVSHGAVGQRIDMRSGRTFTDASKAQDDLGALRATQSAESSINSRFQLATAQARETTAAQNFNSAVRGLSEKLASSGNSSVLADLTGWDNSVRDTGVRGAGTSRTVGGGTEGSSTDRTSDSTRAAGAIAANASIRPPGGSSAGGGTLPVSAGASATASGALSKDKSNIQDHARKWSDNQDLRDDVARRVEGAASKLEGQRGESAQRSAMEIRGALAKVQEAGMQYQTARSEREAVQRVAEEVSQASAGVQVNAAGAVTAGRSFEQQLQLINAAAGAQPGLAVAPALGSNRNAFDAPDGVGPNSGVTPIDRKRADSIVGDAAASVATAQIRIAGGSAAAQEYGQQAIERAYRKINTNVNEGQAVSPSSMVQALQDSARQGNRQALFELLELRNSGVIEFQEKFGNTLPRFPEDRSSPPPPPPPPAPTLGRKG